MPTAYDLVILGSSPAGIHAARQAAQYHARVALVTQNISPIAPLPVSAPPHPTAAWWPAVAEILATQQAPSVLAAEGIDVIVGEGEFVRKPVFQVVAQGRSLPARAYLLATGTVPKLPMWDGLAAVPYYTPVTIAPHLDQFTPGHRVVVLGDDPMALAIAQRLLSQKVQVTVIVASATLLPTEDAEAVDLLQAMLEAEGLTVITTTAVTQIRRIQDQIWVQAGEQVIAADALLLAPESQPNLQSLNLESAKVKSDANGLVINPKQQTTNPRIYTCFGLDRITPYAQDLLAHRQADVALWNALFWPLKTVCTRALPRTVPTQPALYSLGLTEQHARQRYGKAVLVVRQSFNSLPLVQWKGTAGQGTAGQGTATGGLCKLVTHRNGQILGAQILGPAAVELGSAIALALHHRLPVIALAQLATPAQSFAPILSHIALEWQRQRRAQTRWRQDWLEEFWSLRRSL
jgi:pyruvate/2-oxoglutarate dehydrogenase complex dihydrolipoamide dehydrogenase (E3) component